MSITAWRLHFNVTIRSLAGIMIRLPILHPFVVGPDDIDTALGRMFILWCRP